MNKDKQSSFVGKLNGIVGDVCDYPGHSISGCVVCEEAIKAIISLVKSIVPDAEERNDSLAPKHADGWNHLRQEILDKLGGGV